ncbi:MAG: hypothetical protein PXY39_12655 [archaeon]|nr:hypothetical protein [archaeon]
MVYVIGIIPFLLLFYLAALGRKLVLSFLSTEVAIYIVFFRVIPAPAGFPIVAWDIPVVALTVLAVLTRLSSSELRLLPRSPP